MGERWRNDGITKLLLSILYQKIKYDVKNDRAPRVTAKGRSLVADRILAEARKNGIPVYQNKSLVNMLMALEIDREIPPELYRTIAEVLAHVYRIDRHAGDRRSS